MSEQGAATRGDAELPADPRLVIDAFHAGLRETLGSAFAGLWIYGQFVFAPEDGLGDIDFCTLVHRPLDDEERAGLRALHERMGAEHGWLGQELDGYYVTLADARRPEPPANQLRPDISDRSWALHRAHWLAGRVSVVEGPAPETLVRRPSWDELAAALENEIGYVDAHRCEQWAWGYCVLQMCRIVFSFRTRDVVVSKRQAGEWALDVFEPRWHELIRAAMRRYRSEQSPADDALLRTEQEPFVRYANGLLEATDR